MKRSVKVRFIVEKLAKELGVHFEQATEAVRTGLVVGAPEIAARQDWLDAEIEYDFAETDLIHSAAAVLNYLWDDEQSDYFSTAPEDRREHIYGHCVRMAYLLGMEDFVDSDKKEREEDNRYQAGR
jgi:hypothetical protein